MDQKSVMERGVGERMSAPGPFLPLMDGHSVSALPKYFRRHLFRYREGVIYLNAEVSDGTFNFCVSEKEPYRA
jgi:hypothetical protein